MDAMLVNFSLDGARGRFKRPRTPADRDDPKKERRRDKQRKRYHTNNPGAVQTNRRRVNPVPELDNPPPCLNDEDPAPVILPAVRAGVYSSMPHGALELVLPETDVAIDDRCQYGVWDGTYLTRLPYIPSEVDPSRNALSFLERHLFRVVTAAVDARRSPLVDYIPYTNDVVALGQRIRECIAMGKVVVVEGCNEIQTIELNNSDLLARLHIEGSETFQAQDSLAREMNFTAPYETLSMDAFLSNMLDPTKIQAILDTKSVNAHDPVLIGHVDQGYIAADKTNHLFHDIPSDMKSSRVWAIEHHPLFHTLVHHDASGMGTWTSITSGRKFWMIVESDEGEPDCTSWTKLCQYNKRFVMSKKGSADWDFPYAKSARWWCIFGKAGDIIIQPPNVWHEVFTPQKSVTVGGHFYTYNTLHLTDAARRYDIAKPGTTNQHHTSSQLILSAMVVDLARRGPQVYYRKPLTSLCRMILDPTKYLSKTEDARILQCLVGYLANSESDGLQPVAKRAIVIARFLVDKLGLVINSNNYLFQPLPWTSPGEEVELTPDIVQGIVDRM